MLDSKVSWLLTMCSELGRNVDLWKGSRDHNIVLVHSLCSTDTEQQGRLMVFFQYVVIFSLLERGKSVDLSEGSENRSFGIVHSRQIFGQQD